MWICYNIFENFNFFNNICGPHNVAKLIQWRELCNNEWHRILTETSLKTFRKNYSSTIYCPSSRTSLLSTQKHLHYGLSSKFTQNYFQEKRPKRFKMKLSSPTKYNRISKLFFTESKNTRASPNKNHLEPNEQ